MTPATLGMVEQLLRDAWPKLKPHPATCSDILKMIQALQQARAAKDVPTLGKTKKYGRLFLKHLNDAKKQLQEDRRPTIKALLVDTDIHVRAVLDACNATKDRLELAPVVVADVRKALRLSVAEVPRSVNASDPLCRFMVGVFRLIGINLSEATMSDMLRERYHRQRSGRSRAQTASVRAR